MKNNHIIQVLAFVVVVLIVGLISSYITSSHKDKEQKKALKHYYEMLQKQEKYAEKKIEELHKEIYQLEVLRNQDSIIIRGLEYKIKQDGTRLEKERKEASKLTTSEQKDWLVNRYNKSN